MARVALMLKGEGMAIPEMVEWAQRAEAAGYESVWVPEFWRECFVPLAAIAAATSRIGVASGIALAYARSATLMAQAVENLDEVAQGRFIFGLGAGAPDTNALWFDVGDQRRPLTRLREVAEIVRKVLAAREGEEVTFAGQEARVQHFPLTYTPFRARVPLYLGSIKPRSIETAGAIADGVLTGALISLRYLDEVVQPRLKAGVARAGRTADEVDLASLLTCAIADDPEEARAMARHEVATYLPFESIRTVFEVSGFREAREAAAEAFRRHDSDAVLAAVTDEMVDTLTIAGTPEQCREKLEAFRQYVRLPVLIPAAAGLPAAQVRRNTERLLETFAA